MKNKKANIRFIVPQITILLALLQPHLASCQDDWDANCQAETERPQNAHFNMEMNINHCIFRTGDVDDAKKKIDAMLTLKVDAIKHSGGLSQDQIDKLRLAGRGDIMRFYRKVNAVKKECEGLDFNDRRFQKIWPKINTLQNQLSTGLFEGNCLFQKVLAEMARTNSSAPYFKKERERRKYRHRATIELVLTSLETMVPLKKEQREKFLEILLAELEPPKKYGQQDQYVVLFQASKLDEAKIKPIFDESQWQAIKRSLSRAKRMESHLRKEGYIP